MSLSPFSTKKTNDLMYMKSYLSLIIFVHFFTQSDLNLFEIHGLF